jgi:hypothetical protein
VQDGRHRHTGVYALTSDHTREHAFLATLLVGKQKLQVWNHLASIPEFLGGLCGGAWDGNCSFVILGYAGTGQHGLEVDTKSPYRAGRNALIVVAYLPDFFTCGKLCLSIITAYVLYYCYFSEWTDIASATWVEGSARLVDLLDSVDLSSSLGMGSDG